MTKVGLLALCLVCLCSPEITIVVVIIDARYAGDAFGFPARQGNGRRTSARIALLPIIILYDIETAFAGTVGGFMRYNRLVDDQVDCGMNCGFWFLRVLDCVGITAEPR